MTRQFFVNVVAASLLLSLTSSLLFGQEGSRRPAKQPRKESSSRRALIDHDNDADDPDLPGFRGLRIEKEDYLRRRSEHIRVLRGLDSIEELNLKNPRELAVEEMQDQQNRQRIKRQLDANNQSTVIESASEPGAWKELGPSPIPNGQTTRISAPVSGRVTSIAVHPADPDIVYVGTAQGGLYRSLNGGNSWRQLMDGAKSLAIGAIAISPSNTSTIWVGTGEASFSCSSFFGVGLYRIEDADTDSPKLYGPFNRDGNNNDIFSYRSIGEILVHPTDPNTIFVASASGIGGMGCEAPVGAPIRGLYRSTNAMSPNPKFSPVTISGVNDLSITDMIFEPQNPNKMVISVRGTSFEGGGIYKTNNAISPNPVFTRTLTLGANGTRVRASLSANKIGNTVTIYAATGESGTGACATYRQHGQLRVSTDAGETWSSPIGSANGFCGAQCSYDIAVAVAPDNANNVLLGGSANSICSGVLKRATNGSNFSASDVGLHADTHAIAFAPSNPSVVYTGNDGGVWRSTDGGINWTSLNKSGFNATQFMSLALHPTDPNFTIGGTQDNGTQWLRPDGTFVRADFGDGGYAQIDQNAKDSTVVTMYHTYFNAPGAVVGFARVTHTGDAQDYGWEFFGCGGTPNGIGCYDSAVQFYAPMAIGPGNPNSLYFGTDRLYRSSDRGENMAIVSQQFVAGAAITAIGISPQNDKVRIVGLETGKVYRTMNGFPTLEDVTGPIPAYHISRAVIDPKDVNTAYVTFSGFGLASGQHIWKTSNLNALNPTWKPMGMGVPDVPVNAFVVDPENSYNLYAGTDIGIFSSTDGGLNWASFGSGLPVVAVFDMAIHNPARILRIATHGRGLWETSIALNNPPPPPPPPVDIPINPTGLTATAVSTTQVDLKWNDNSENETGFIIERCQGAGCSNFSIIAELGINRTTYSDTGLALATTYSYRVKAFNGAGNSDYSNIATVSTASPPQTQFVLTATTQNASQIYLSWNIPPNNVLGFRIDRCVGAPCTNFTPLVVLGASVSSYIDSGLPSGVTHNYRITAITNNDTIVSNVASATTLANPGAPSNLVAETLSPSQIRLKWVDNSSNEVGFRIERCLGAGCENFTQIALVGADTTEIIDIGLVANTTYNYRVLAFNGTGVSAYSNIATATTLFINGIPAVPSNLRVVFTSSNRVDVAWDDNSENEMWFELVHQIRGERYGRVVYLSPNTTFFSTTGLNRLTTYYYRIRACNSNGCSPYSAEIPATTK